MKRNALYGAMLAAMLAIGAGSSFGLGTAQAQPSPPIMQDIYGQHPQMIAPGTAEYDYLMMMKKQAQKTPGVDQNRLNAGLEACAQISPLSPELREKCEVKAHQQAELPVPPPKMQ